MSWAPAGDRIAYFARTEKNKTLILQNVVTKKIEKRIELKSVDSPSRPTSARTAREVAFAAPARRDRRHLHRQPRDRADPQRHQRQFGDYAPTYAPDGKSIIYLARVSGNDKLFRLDLATGKKTQLTFGTHDDGGAQFIDADTIVFPSTAVDPNQPIDPEVARNGNIYNIWTLNLKNGELKQYTDTLTGNVSPIVLRDQKPPKIAFVTYYKGEYGIHTLPREEPLHTVAIVGLRVAGSDHRLQAAAQSHTLVQSNIHKKGTFEKLFLEGRPPVALGVTSGGDLFGGTEVTFSDVLGDKQFNMFAVVGLAVPDAVVLVCEPVASAAVRAAGVLADAVLLRLRSRAALRRRVRVCQPRPGDRDADGARRDGIRHLSVQPLRPGRVLGRLSPIQAGLQRRRAPAGRQ